MNYEAILYDMDGVIIDTHRCAYSVLSESAREHGVQISPDEIIGLGSLSGKQFWEYIKDKYNLRVSVNELISSYDFMKEMDFYDEIWLACNIESTLKVLLRAGYKIGLVTSGKLIRVNKILSLFKEPGLFHTVVTADDVTEHKPSPMCYLLALDKLSVVPSKSLVIEDSSNGALSAQAAGCDVVAFKGAMWKHDSFEAKYYIEDHSELLDLV